MLSGVGKLDLSEELSSKLDSVLSLLCEDLNKLSVFLIFLRFWQRLDKAAIQYTKDQ